MDRQDICPGYDDNTEMPIGYSLIKDALEIMGVIYQWIFYYKEGEGLKMKTMRKFKLIHTLGREIIPYSGLHIVIVMT